MPAGLINAALTFQRHMDEGLRRYLDVNVTAYMDDELIPTSGNRNEYWVSAHKIRKNIENMDLFLDIEFFCKEVKYLEFITRV